MSSPLNSFVRVVLVAFLAGLAPAAAHAQALPDVPTALQAPEGTELLFRAFAAGTQNYACQDGVWTFRQPKAILVGDDGEQIGIHGRGPVWLSYDGSSVVGSAPVSSPAADPAHDVPSLLLRGTPAETAGRFANVSYIQRLDTRGGTAPASACESEQTVAVPYLAVYYFYGPAPAAALSTDAPSD